MPEDMPNRIRYEELDFEKQIVLNDIQLHL